MPVWVVLSSFSWNVLDIHWNLSISVLKVSQVFQLILTNMASHQRDPPLFCIPNPNIDTTNLRSALTGQVAFTDHQLSMDREPAEWLQLHGLQCYSMERMVILKQPNGLLILRNTLKMGKSFLNRYWKNSDWILFFYVTAWERSKTFSSLAYLIPQWLPLDPKILIFIVFRMLWTKKDGTWMACNSHQGNALFEYFLNVHTYLKHLILVSIFALLTSILKTESPINLLTMSKSKLLK